MNRRSERTEQKAPNALKRLGALGLFLTLALMSGGCVSNDEFDQARMDRDEFRGELQRLHLSNDDLKREISATYASCDQLGTQLTVMAALDIHDKYTDKLGRPPKQVEVVNTGPSQNSPPSGSSAGQGSVKVTAGNNNDKDKADTGKGTTSDSTPVKVKSGYTGLDGMDF